MIGFVRISNVKEINSEKDNSSKEEIVSAKEMSKRLILKRPTAGKKKFSIAK